MLDTVVMSGDDVCCCVVFCTLVGVFVFCAMWSELLMTSTISCPLWSSVYECQSVDCQGLLDFYRPGSRFVKSELSLGSKPTIVKLVLHNHHRYYTT